MVKDIFGFIVFWAFIYFLYFQYLANTTPQGRQQEMMAYEGMFYCAVGLALVYLVVGILKFLKSKKK